MSTPPLAEQQKIGEHTRNVIEQARAISRRAAMLYAAHRQLQESARTQAAALYRELVAARLAAVPTSDLRRIVSRGLRLGKLEQAGFDTVAKIRATSHHRLLQIPGVGAQTVEEVKDAAEKAARQLAAETRFRFDPDAKSPNQTALLATLAAERSAAASAMALRDDLRRYELGIQGPLPEAEKAASKWRMFWSGRRRKDRALAALAALEAVVYGLETRALVPRLDAALAQCDPTRRDAGELWHEYETDAAAFNTALARLTGTDVADAGALEDFIGEELRQRIEAVPFDASLLLTDLRMYQLFGAKYAIHQERSIIGDEMGLGKTIQALAVCAHLAAKGQRRFLVVCPASVQVNWIAEIAKHTRLASYSLHGAGREAEGKRWLRLGGVAVTTFDTLARLQCLKHHDAAGPALLIVDEAHYIKNRDAKRSQAVAALSTQAQRTLFLTGTPMENRVDEFKNLVSYLRPALAAKVGDGETIAGAKAFRRLVASVYLRRNQEDVLTELPEKIEVEDWIRLSATDEATYRACVLDRNLMGMRRAASAMPGSEKLDRLEDLVQEAVEDGLKVIVFSYFLDVLKAVGERLGSVVTGQINGSVSAVARQELIDRFTRVEGPAVLVAQIEAGGVGLNIQAASVVVICEPQWKPSTEQQAIARAHRMGQARKVQVHRLLAKDCIDERIREIQEDKALLFDHYARRSEAKEVDGMAVATGFARPAALDDESVPLKERIIVAERARLGLD